MSLCVALEGADEAGSDMAWVSEEWLVACGLWLVVGGLSAAAPVGPVGPVGPVRR